MGKAPSMKGGFGLRRLFIFPPKYRGGKVIDESVVTYDYLPTFCEMLRVDSDELFQQPDGISLWSLWTGKDNTLPERSLYWHYPLENPHFLGGRSSAAVRSGDWKLIQFYDSGEFELYNLKNDIGESDNLAAQYPEIVNQLIEKLNGWRHEVGVGKQ